MTTYAELDAQPWLTRWFHTATSPILHRTPGCAALHKNKLIEAHVEEPPPILRVCRICGNREQFVGTWRLK